VAALGPNTSPFDILGHDGVWNTTADDIAEYYIANYYDQVSSWIAEHKSQA